MHQFLKPQFVQKTRKLYQEPQFLLTVRCLREIYERAFHCQKIQKYDQKYKNSAALVLWIDSSKGLSLNFPFNIKQIYAN